MVKMYLLPTFWASALINNDESGLTDSDVAELDAWLEIEKPGRCVGCSEESNFEPYHDASNHVLPCDCCDYTFQKRK